MYAEGSTHLLVTLVILGCFGGGEWDGDGVEGAVVVEAPAAHNLKRAVEECPCAFPAWLSLIRCERRSTTL